jgi:hypothetical protein
MILLLQRILPLLCRNFASKYIPLIMKTHLQHVRPASSFQVLKHDSNLVQDAVVDHQVLSPIAIVGLGSLPPATSLRLDEPVTIVEPTSETTRSRFRTSAIMVGLCVRIPTAQERYNLIQAGGYIPRGAQSNNRSNDHSHNQQ